MVWVKQREPLLPFDFKPAERESIELLIIKHRIRNSILRALMPCLARCRRNMDLGQRLVPAEAGLRCQPGSVAFIEELFDAWLAGGTASTHIGPDGFDTSADRQPRGNAYRAEPTDHGILEAEVAAIC